MIHPTNITNAPIKHAYLTGTPLEYTMHRIVIVNIPLSQNVTAFKKKMLKISLEQKTARKNWTN